ncbi:MAG TPA: Asp-tRNA(Asn)/Glu-tRNA(Gln) amidotransferase subunit GatA [Candidatus Tectomicrobia bacterium]|nr:Asp-tRNA(Asn)/Glu-tRNA(Gln) amidotransferase subunit GatA [Candidatus Tectomicrobia bacterium]
MDLHALTIHELCALLDKREVSAREVTEAFYGRIDAVDDRVRAYLTLTRDLAFEQADRADRRRQAGERGPLLGVPLAIKDVICTKGVRTTCGSKILQNFVPPYDATVMERLNAAGAILLGKANMDEFAMGSSTEHSAYGITRNPWDLHTIPGGSSGGSAAAVAADECAAALGTDTGGSIRQPAACCGIVGLKPTYGRVSRYGLVAFASSLDQIGPMTKDVRDAALLLHVIAGNDVRDSTSADLALPDFTRALNEPAKGLRIGIPREYFVEGSDAEVERAVREAIKVLEGLGAVTADISLPHTEYGVAVYYILASSEASSNLARYDGIKYGYRVPEWSNLRDMYMRTRDEGFGAEVKRRIMLGTYALSAGYYDAYYKKSQQVRTLLLQDFEAAFRQVDVVIAPTAPTPAFKIGEKTDDPLQMYLSDIFTVPVNLAGIPGISLPCGFSSAGLPIGLQIIGRPFDEETILRVAYAFEQQTDYHRRKPPL